MDCYHHKKREKNEYLRYIYFVMVKLHLYHSHGCVWIIFCWASTFPNLTDDNIKTALSRTHKAKASHLINNEILFVVLWQCPNSCRMKFSVISSVFSFYLYILCVWECPLCVQPAAFTDKKTLSLASTQSTKSLNIHNSRISKFRIKAAKNYTENAIRRVTVWIHWRNNNIDIIYV